MNDFNPGEGWQEVDERRGRVLPKRGVIRWFDDDGYEHIWVREEPVPPLPTAQDTVIAVTWAKGARSGVTDRLWLAAEGCWVDSLGTQFNPVPEGIITGFEVLAEPKRTLKVAETAVEYPVDIEQLRRETAKAVLDRVKESMTYGATTGLLLDRIASNFGVSS